MRHEMGSLQPELSLGGSVGTSGIEVKLRNSHTDVRAALAEIKKLLEERALTTDDIGTVEIILAEALNNIVKHAYSEETANEILIRVIDQGSALECALLDCGGTFPTDLIDGTLNAPFDGEDGYVEEDLPEGGFGWFLIRTLARNIRYRRYKNQNHLKFRIPLAQRHDGIS